MVEKVGHSKRMQIERKTWIDEGKPKPDYIDDRENMAIDPQSNAAEHQESRVQPSRDDGVNDILVTDDRPTQNEAPDVPDDDDDLDALLAAQSEAPPAKAPREPDSEGEDDLDALLADYDSRKFGKAIFAEEKNTNHNEDSEQDEMDTFLAAHDNGPALQPDDLDELLAEHDNQGKHASPSQGPQKDPEDDDEDAINALYNHAGD